MTSQMRRYGKIEMQKLRENETYISFYLRANRIHIFIDALREIGEPNNICFMIGKNGTSLVLKPYKKKDLKSHRVCSDVYHGCKSMEVSSMRLCRILIDMFHWNPEFSYRAPGIIYPSQRIVVFDLAMAEAIEHER